jgi:uncharacterized protein YegP (UPF0339 family)
MKVTIYKADDGWRWRAQAANNEIVAHGEAYENKADAQHAIDLVFTHHPDGITIDTTTDDS